MAWFRADDFDIRDARLVSKSTTAQADSHYWMLSFINGNRLRARLKTDDGVTATLIADTGDVVAGVWTHAALTFDGNWLRIYKDGVLVAETAKVGSLAVNPAVEAWIGDNPSGNKGFDGIIDEVKIFHRGLSQAEVQTEMSTP